MQYNLTAFVNQLVPKHRLPSYLSDRAQMLLELEQIAQTVKLRLDQHQTRGRTLTLKVKFSDYQQITRSKTVLTPIRELSA